MSETAAMEFYDHVLRMYRVVLRIVGETFEKEFTSVIWDRAGKVRHSLLRARKQLQRTKNEG